MRRIRLTTLATAVCLVIAVPALGDKPASKSADDKAARAPKDDPGSAARAGDNKPRQPLLGKQDKGRDEPGRPASSDDVPGKARGLDKQPAGKALGRDKQGRDKARPPGAKEATDETDETTDEAVEQRKWRKKARVEALKRRWGAALSHPSALAEQRVHARRMARLERMRELLAESGKDEKKTLDRIEELIAKEEKRHMSRMSELSERPQRPGAPDIEKVGHQGKPKAHDPATGASHDSPSKAKDEAQQ